MAELHMLQEHAGCVQRILWSGLPKGTRVSVFSSRPTGCGPKTHSDLDLLIDNPVVVPLLVEADLRKAFAESNLPFTVNLLDYSDDNVDFLARLEHEGMIELHPAAAQTDHERLPTPLPTQLPRDPAVDMATNTSTSPVRPAPQRQLSTRRPEVPAALTDIGEQLRGVLAHFPSLVLAIVFGSVARGKQRANSGFDIAVAASQALTATEKIALISALAQRTGRPVDLIDLRVAAEPSLGQIVRHGRRLQGSDNAYGQLISRHLFERADFMPYRTRLLAERRAAWISQ